MATAGADRASDWLEDPGVRRWAFTAPQLAFLVGFLLPVSLRAVLWPVALVVTGSVCVLNARRCGRVHCYFSGPFFLASALVVVAYGVGWIGRIPGGWNGVGLGLVGTATVLNVLPERLWGRYR